LVAFGLVYYALCRRDWKLRAGAIAAWLLLLGLAYARAHVHASLGQAAEAVTWGFVALATAVLPFVALLFSFAAEVRL